jgi:hypothetical protein
MKDRDFGRLNGRQQSDYFKWSHEHDSAQPRRQPSLNPAVMSMAGKTLKELSPKIDMNLRLPRHSEIAHIF